MSSSYFYVLEVSSRNVGATILHAYFMMPLGNVQSTKLHYYSTSNFFKKTSVKNKLIFKKIKMVPIKRIGKHFAFGIHASFHI